MVWFIGVATYFPKVQYITEPCYTLQVNAARHVLAHFCVVTWAGGTI